MEYINPIIDNAKDLWEKLGISYDYFIRTTDEDHCKRVQEIFKNMYDIKVFIVLLVNHSGLKVN